MARSSPVSVRGWRSAGETGQALVEMALLTPVLLLILVGIVDFGLGMFAWSGAGSAAREGAKFAADGANNTNTTTLITNSFNAVLPTAATAAWTDAWVIRFGTDNGGTIITSGTNAWTATQLLNGASVNGTLLTTAQMQSALNAGASGAALANLKFVVVQIYYEHATLFGWFGPRVPINTWSVNRDVSP